MEHIGLTPLFRRWWPLLLAGTVLAAMMGYLYASASPKTYHAEARLLIGPLNTDYGTLRASGELGRTYADLATSRPVLQHVIDRTRTETTPTELAPAVSATSNQITRVVTLGVEYGDPKVAADLANALAARIKEMAAETPPQLTESIGELMRQGEIEKLDIDEREGVSAAALRIFGTSLAGRAEMVDPAKPVTDPVAPRTNLLTLLAGLAGLLIVGVFALVRESSRSSVADERVLAELDRPVFLGSLDASRSRSADAALSVEQRPESTVAEGYRSIATKIGLVDERPSVRSLLIVDSSDGTTAGVVAANLAAVLAEANVSVLLLDANTTEHGATRLLGLEGQPGYSELVETAHHAELNGEVDEFRITRTDDFAVLPRGTAVTTGMLDYGRARRVLSRLLDDADLVIVSAPPIHRSPAALVWARVANGALLVIDDGRTSEEELSDVLKSLSLVDANVLGTVLGRRKRFQLRKPSKPLERSEA